MILGWSIWTITYLAVLLGLVGYGLHRYLVIFLFFKHARRSQEPESRFAELPLVTVQLPIYNELHVASRLLEAVATLDYPKSRLQIQVLDDSTDSTRELLREKSAELVRAGFVVDLIHRTDRSGYKAGALENGLKTAQGDFILILDADFVPNPDLLAKTIHYFTDPKVGMVQTRWGHINRDYSLLTKVQAMFLDGHLVLEQTARSRSGRFFNFNGTAGIWRRSCIEAAGGWQHDTLTEDLDLSYRAQLAGWRFVFLPWVVTPAELPVDMNGFKSQQHRWTKGSIQTCKKILSKVWGSSYPLFIKLEATAHLTANFAYLLLAALCLLLHPGGNVPGDGVLRLLWFDIPVFVATTVSVSIFYLTAQVAAQPRRWFSSVLLLPMVIALGIGLSLNNAKAVLEALFNHQSAFARTPKYAIKGKGDSWKGKLYAPVKSALPIFELGFALYFGYLFIDAVRVGHFITAPFLLLFFIGFGYVAFCSMANWLPSGQKPPIGPAESGSEHPAIA